jgi:cyanate permease
MRKHSPDMCLGNWVKRCFAVRLAANRNQECAIDSEDKQPYQARYRWVMLMLVSLLYGCFGLVSRSLAPLVTPVLQDLNISNSEMGLILGSWPLTYIAVAATGGAIIDRWGIHKSLLIGIIIIGFSETLRYFANGFATLFLFVALFGLGGPMISIGCPKTISIWFSGKERATAVGVYTASSTTGRLIALSATNSVLMPLTGYSWRLTFVGYGLIVFTIALVWWFLARDVTPTEHKENVSVTRVFVELITIRNVQFILMIGFLSMVTSHGLSDWLPRIMETSGLPPAVAGFAASIPDLVSMPFAMFGPRMVPPSLRGRIVATMSLVGAVALFMVATTSGIPLLLGLILLGAINWASVPLLMLVLMDMPQVGPRYMGSVGGMYFCVSEIGGFTGPLMMGALADTTGNFMTGVFTLAVLRLAISVMALLIRTRPAFETRA